MKKLGIIIQARMSSSRLPNKVLANIEGKPMIWHLINRLKHSKFSPLNIIATSNQDEDKVLLEVSENLNIEFYSGSLDDVLDRFYQASLKFNIDPIIRITADCPVIDPEVVDKVIQAFIDGNYDYVSNGHPPTYPDGLDTEIFSFKTLEKVWKEAKLSSEREHVTSYILKNSNLFKIYNVVNDVDLSHLRWTVDEKDDLEFIREIYKYLYKKEEIFLKREILDLLKEKPELIEINRFKRNKGYDKSVKLDKIVK